MKTAGKAFIGGLFGALGVAVAVIGTGAAIGLFGEHVIRKTIREAEAALQKMKEES